MVGHEAPWIVLHVWGFKDAPVAWDGCSHSVTSDISGENNYTLIILPRGHYLLFVAAGRGDGFGGVPE